VSTPTALVVTSISPPNAILRALASGAVRAGVEFIVIGDTKSPADFALDGCRFLDVSAQLSTGFALAAACPTRHYARKNIGYLVAIRHGAHVIIETDDDNWPADDFFAPRRRQVSARGLRDTGWVNLYRYFSDATIWPRGLPLDAIHGALPPYELLELDERDCPIQQGLADENPDVDAVYRLVLPLPQRFRRDRAIAIGRGTWCPFNSQNTAWWPDAFPLLYLPAFCSFRMTDIWRSLVAARIAAENGWWILFHEATVRQERNEHNLMKDFADEVPGYLHNRQIGSVLQSLSLRSGLEHVGDNLRRCYAALIELGVIGSEELALVDAWLSDLRSLAADRS
jgi:STELLO glycosyltransferases